MKITENFERTIAPFFWVDHDESASVCLNVGEYLQDVFDGRAGDGFEGSGTVLMQYDGMTAEAIYSKTAVSVTPSVIQGETGSLLIDYVSRPETLELRLRKGSRDPLSGGNTEMLPYTPADNNMIYEIREFIRLIKNKEVNHKYLQYSLDTIRIIDEVRRQNGIVFPGANEK